MSYESDAATREFRERARPRTKSRVSRPAHLIAMQPYSAFVFAPCRQQSERRWFRNRASEFRRDAERENSRAIWRYLSARVFVNALKSYRPQQAPRPTASNRRP